MRGLLPCGRRRRTRPEQGGSVIPRRAPTLKRQPDYVAFGRILSIPNRDRVTPPPAKRDRSRPSFDLPRAVVTGLADRTPHPRTTIIAAAAGGRPRRGRRRARSGAWRRGKRTTLDRRGLLPADPLEVAPGRAVAVVAWAVVPLIRARAHHDRRTVPRITVVAPAVVARAIPAAIARVRPVPVAAAIAIVAVDPVVRRRIAVVVVATRGVAVAVAGAHAPAEQDHRQQGEQEFAEHGCLRVLAPIHFKRTASPRVDRGSRGDVKRSGTRRAGPRRRLGRDLRLQLRQSL